MPKTTISHEPWCAEHLNDRDSCGNGEICSALLPSFGPDMTDGVGDTYPRGSFFIDQPEAHDEPALHIEFSPGRTGAMDVDAARSIFEALKADPDGLQAALELALKTIEAGAAHE